MDITITPGILSGTLSAIPSKSQAHRLLICAAFADKPTTIYCPETSRDIEATVDCLNALGAEITRSTAGYQITPIATLPEKAILNCSESGSTLRFMLPLVGALGVDGTFQMSGRLPQRPLSPLWEQMQQMGCILTRYPDKSIRCQGQLRPGVYRIPGNISSQYITGLLLALVHLQDESKIFIDGKLESKPYVDLTLQTMQIFGISASIDYIPGNQRFHSPGVVTVEGDWSNAAFFLTAKALGNPLTVTGLNPDSVQGDRKIAILLSEMKENIVISAADIPDLIPVLSVMAACNQGSVFTDIQRLRLKESDRVAAVIAMIENLGGKATSTENTLTIYGTGLNGGIVDSVNDHRIAMSAAIAATVCKQPVTILGSECVQKSYPTFFDEYRRLGGIYEQYLR